MNTRAALSIVVGAALAALIVVVALLIDEPDASPPPAAVSPGASSGAAAERESPSSVDAGTPSVGQLLRTTERATIAGVAVDHDPMARGTTVRMAVEVAVVAGMHVNANPPSEAWLIPVEASIAGARGVHVIDAFYPEAETRKFPYSEQPFLVYEDTFVIGMVLALDADLPPGGRQLEILLDYQACNDEACFEPTRTSAVLPIMVVADEADARVASSPILERAPFPR